MKEFNNAGLRQTLEQLPTSELDDMLRTELAKEPPDEHGVRMILKILREREADYPVESNAQIDRAWEEYREKTAPRNSKRGTALLRIASTVIVIGALMAALPQEANARSFFDRIASWTDSIFELFSPSDFGRHKEKYIFKTNHPGLQEVYDTITELGVTVPVVPMWLDESYVLAECRIMESPSATYLIATFMGGGESAVYELKIFSHNIASEFHKNEPCALYYENNGRIYSVVQNNERWTAVWAIENIECSIFLNCQEDELYKILDSIYTMEE